MKLASYVDYFVLSMYLAILSVLYVSTFILSYVYVCTNGLLK